jgi:TetR/AcrR family transcriptional regulator, mexJK operon transcriptional repressor
MTELPRRQMNRLIKEKRILAAALKVFSENGYSGASMDVVATEAGLTKPTLYQYFDSKEQLFATMMLQKRDDMLSPLRDPRTGDMVVQLHRFAWAYADTVMHPDLLSLARLTIGEVQRFPEIGRAYQAAGPERVLEGLMGYLTAYRAAGRLTFDDAELAAEDLWGLILSAPRTQALYKPDNVITREALARYVHNGLRVFLRAYSSNPTADLETLKGQEAPDLQQVTE